MSREGIELDQITPKYYPILNEYIVKGKRALHQKDLVEKTEELVFKLRDNLINSFINFKTEHFFFKDDGAPVLYWKEKGKNVASWCIYVPTLPMKLSYDIAFRDVLSEFNRCVDSVHVEIKTELDELLMKVKKATFFPLFEFMFWVKRNRLYRHAFEKKEKSLLNLYSEIRKMWEEDFPLTVGQKVSYRNMDYKGCREGVVTEILPDGAIMIKSNKGRKVKRPRYFIEYDTEFCYSKLGYYLNELDDRVPEIWKEKTLQFFK